MAVPQPVVVPGRRRWWLLAAIIGIVLVVYAVTLTWATRRLERDIQKSFQPLPAAQAGRSGGEQ